MSDFVFAIRFKADGTAEVVSAATAVEGATTRVGKAGEETGRKIKASADQAGAAQARLAQLIDQTRTPLERLQAQIAELETLVPFANSDQEIEALIRASDRLEGALAGQGAAAQVASAAQARLSQLVDQTRTPVERLTAQLSELEALRPFAGTVEQAEALDRATSRIRDTLEAHTAATGDAAEAQERLSRLIDQTRTPAERLRATYAELEKLRPFAQTGEEVLALERALATARAGLAAEADGAKEAAAAHAQLSRLMEQTATPVERLRGELESLEALKPFTRTAEDSLALERALARARAALKEAEEAADPVAVAARRDAEAFQALRDRLDPAAKSTRELTASQALLDRALAGQVPGVRLTDAQHAALSKTLRDQHSVIDASTGKVKLAGWQVQQLGMQVQDAGVQLMGGQNPFLIIAQQAPQAAGAVGGFGNAMRLLATPVTAAAVGVGLLVGAAAMVGSRIADISAEARTLNTELRALNPELKVTAESMRLMAFSIAEQTGASRQDAAGALLTAAKNRAIRDVGLLRDIAAVAQDVAAITGEAAYAVAGKIASAYAKGAAGIAQLDEELGFLTRAQAEHVRLLDDQGRRTEALGVATAALKERFGHAVVEMRSAWGNAFHDMGAAWDSFADRVANSSFGKWLAEQTANAARGWKALLSGPTPDQQTVALNRDAFQKERELADLEKKRGRLPDPALETRITSLKAEVEDLRRREAELIARQREEASAVAARGTGAPGYAPGGGRPRTGSITDDEGKRLDAAAEANERYFKALQKVGAERQIALAGAQAYEEALRRGDGRQARLEAAAQAETRARKELGATIADQTAQYSLQVRGLLGVADAYGVSTAAAVVAQAHAQALTDSLQSNVDVEQRTSELVLQGAAQQAAAIAQATDAMKLEVEWTVKIAAATKDGAAARDEATRQADVARQTSQLLAHAQAAEAMGDAELAKKLRALAAGYDDTSKALARAKQMAAGAEAIRTSKLDLEYARAELGLMREAEPVRERALASLRIQRQAMELFRDVSTDALRQQRDEWVALQEQIADVQALQQFQQQVKAVSEDISKDVAEALYDRLMDPDKATSVVDFFKSIFKRLAVEALKTRIILPIVTQVVGSLPSLFGIQAPANGGTATNSATDGSSLYGQVAQWFGGKVASYGADQLGLSSTSIGNSIYNGAAEWLGMGGTEAAAQSTMWSSWGAGGDAAMAAWGGGSTTAAMTASEGMYSAAAGTAQGAGGGLTAGGSSLSGAASGILGAIGTAYSAYSLGGAVGTRANSKAAGAGTGAAVGAVGGFMVGGPWGALIGAVLGAILGAVGTKKLATPYGGAWVETDSSGQVYNRAQGAENGVNEGDLVKQVDAINTVMTGLAKVSGLSYDRLTIATEFSGGKNGKGALTHLGGWDGPVVSRSESPAKIALDVLGHLRDAGKLTLADEPGVMRDQMIRPGGDTLTATLAGRVLNKAINTSDGSNIEEIVKAVGLAKSVADSTTALNQFDKSLQGVADRARKAQTDALQPMRDEMELARKYDFLPEYSALIGRQLTEMASALANPPDWTPTETALAEFRGQIAALRDAAVQADPALGAVVDQLGNAGIARLQRAYQDQSRDRIEALEGRGYLKSVRDINSTLDLARRDETALGLDHSASQREYDLGIRSALHGLTAQQLDDVARTFGGSIAALAAQMRQSALTADRTTLELNARQRDAEAAAGRVPSGVAEANRISIQRAQELADAENDLVRARLQAIYALEDEGRALERQRHQRDVAADLYGRGLTLMGDAGGAALLRYNLQAAQETERAVASNDNLPLLGIIQAAERARTVADALRQDLMTAIDRQVKVISDNTTAQREVVQKWGQLTSLATSADTALTGSSSTLGDWDKLVEARRQFEAALTTWNDTSLSDDVRFAAAGRLQALGQARIDAAKGWFGGTDSSDFVRVTGVWKSIGDTAQQQVDAAQAQITLNERQLKSLEAARQSAEALGERQIGSIETLTAQTTSAFQTLTTAVNAVATAVRTSVGTTAPNPVPVVEPVLTPEQRYLRDNPDVAAAGLDAAHHYSLYGAREGRDRDGLRLTRDQEYLARYPDVAAAVTRGEFSSGEDHYARFGQFEGRTFAKGGVMTPWGELPLTSRSAGGVASSPTLTVYGEGDRPEAFVPLQDGRTIPVTVRFPTAAPVADSAATRRVADLLGEQNGLIRAVLAELERNTRTTASAGAQAANEARQACALTARQLAVQERLGLRRVA